jgi:LmbE family N-acetylglucosaminyl deacetylase
MTPGLDLLVVVAHPDDEALCAAGTLALRAAYGGRTGVVCATRGEQGPISDPALATRETLGSVRESELRRSCAVLGVSEVVVLDAADGGVAWEPRAQLVQQLVVCLRRLRPQVVIGFGPDGLYGHADHIALSELLVDARRCAARDDLDAEGLPAFQVPRHFFAVWTGEQVRALLASVAPQGQLWGLSAEHFPVTEREVTAIVDVRAVLRQKLEALRCHRTQLAEDHALVLVDERAAGTTLGLERFRCADGLAGGPI